MKIMLSEEEYECVNSNVENKEYLEECTLAFLRFDKIKKVEIVRADPISHWEEVKL